MLDDNAQDLISICTRIIYSLKDPRKVKTHLKKLISPLLCTTDRNLKLISFVFSSIGNIKASISNPLLVIFDKLFPILIKAVDNCQSIGIIESVGIIMKNSMRCIPDHVLSYLSTFISCIKKNFENTGISNYLYYAEFTVSVYGSSEESSQLLLPMIDYLGKITSNLIQSHNSTNEQLISDFLGLCLRCIEYSPKLFFDSQILTSTLELAISVIDTKHSECKTTLCLFLYHLFNYLKNKEPLNDIKEIEVWNFLISKAQEIIKRLFINLVEGQHKAEYLIDLIIKMYLVLPVNCVCYFLDAVKAVLLL